MTKWVIDEIAARFDEAAETGRRLPPVRVQGYFNVWPAFAHNEWEGFVDKNYVHKLLPPTPEAIDRMLEAMRWMQWLEVDQRHLVWMRAKHYEWHKIAKRFGCCTKTAQRRWQRALQIVADHLNDVPAPACVSNFNKN